MGGVKVDEDDDNLAAFALYSVGGDLDDYYCRWSLTLYGLL